MIFTKSLSALALLAALTTTAPAHADVPLTPDQQQYADTYGADAICIVIAAYPNPDGVVGVAMGVMKDGFTADDSVDIVNYAVQTYCPQWWDLLTRTGDLYRHKQLKRAV